MITVLDCTLRDGGYCNDWNFGYENIIKIINGLKTTGINYVECGFLSKVSNCDTNKTIFNDINELKHIIPKNEKKQKYLLMINYGEYCIEDIPCRKYTNIDGIRVSFHKKNQYEAIDFCSKIKEKGYAVFVQPMVCVNYNKEEFTELIESVNKLHLDAFYIVDSFGMMKHTELLEYMKIADDQLLDSIYLGFHAHNNLQLAFSNAQTFVETLYMRNLIVDVTIHGMGRGAGNLNSELFLDYLNEETKSRYSIQPILILMDEIISNYYARNSWGYNFPNYLAASKKIHPNYANYLSQKKTLTIEMMDKIFRMIHPNKKMEYDEAYIETLYIRKLSETHPKSLYSNLVSDISNKKVLLIAPGLSSANEKETIISFIMSNNPVVISINYDYPHYNSSYIFISNMRRFRQLGNDVLYKTIITSNIESSSFYAIVEYKSLLNDIPGVRDNAGLMAIQLMMNLNASEIFLAGFDGYNFNNYENYGSDSLTSINAKEQLEMINAGLSQALCLYGRKCKIYSLTRFSNLSDCIELEKLYIKNV